VSEKSEKKGQQIQYRKECMSKWMYVLSLWKYRIRQ